jgi:hypothetical protein
MKVYITPRDGKPYSFTFKYVYRIPEYPGLLFIEVLGLETNRSTAFSKIRKIHFTE